MEKTKQGIKDLMSGKEYEKDYVQVGYEGKQQENLGGETRESELSKLLNQLGWPLFCPNCKKVNEEKT